MKDFLLQRRECPKQRYCDRIEKMKKLTEASWKKCPKCGKTKNQIEQGIMLQEVSAANVRSAASTTPLIRSSMSTRKKSDNSQ